MCEYDPVLNSHMPPEGPDEDQDRSWKPFLRQLLISSCVWSMLFQLGLCFGAATVIFPRMREERGEEYVSKDMASWISSAVMYAGVPWIPVMVFLASAIGRRYTFVIFTITSIAGFVVLALGDTPLYVLAAMIIQGPVAALSNTISFLVLSEYISPVNRGVFFSIKSATFYWAVWVANAIGTVTHWHYIGWLGFVCAMYNLLTFFLWPESPYWLASKGKMEQCREAHRWLKGHGVSSEKELQELINEDMPNCVEDDEFPKNQHKKTSIEKLRQICQDIKSKCFYKSFLLITALVCHYQFTGKTVCIVYAIDIIKSITKSRHEAYKGMLILDGVTVLGMYVGCGLSKKLTRRMLLIFAGGAGSVFLLIMSIYLFLVRMDVIFENKYITISLLTCYSLSVGCGPIILIFTFAAELLPLHLRGIATLIMAIDNCIITGTSIKIGPYIFSSLGSDGAFLFYSLTSGSILMFLYFYLPETKDKTLKEIQDLILGIKTERKQEPIEMKEYKFENEDVCWQADRQAKFE